MEAIVCVLIILQFISIAVVAATVIRANDLYRKTVEIVSKPPAINLEPVYNDIKQLQKDVDNFKSASVLRAAFK